MLKYTSNFLCEMCFVLGKCMYLVLSTVIFAGPFQISSPVLVDLLWSTSLDDPPAAESIFSSLV